MEKRRTKVTLSHKKETDAFDLDALLHPASAFRYPMDVVRDPDLTLNEKRAILASWASDACAVEVAPALRSTKSGSVVRWDDIMDALRILDGEAEKYGKPIPTTSACWREKLCWDQPACVGEIGTIKANH